MEKRRIQSIKTFRRVAARLIYNSYLNTKDLGILGVSDVEIPLEYTQFSTRVVILSKHFTVYNTEKDAKLFIEVPDTNFGTIRSVLLNGKLDKTDYKYCMLYIKYSGVHAVFSDDLAELKSLLNIKEMDELKIGGVNLTIKMTKKIWSMLSFTKTIYKNLLNQTLGKYTTDSEMLSYLNGLKIEGLKELDTSIKLNIVNDSKREWPENYYTYRFITNISEFIDIVNAQKFIGHAYCKKAKINSHVNVGQSTQLNMIGEKVLVRVFYNSITKICKLHIIDKNFEDSTEFKELLNRYKELK